jgi:hypothetical protein
VSLFARSVLLVTCVAFVAVRAACQTGYTGSLNSGTAPSQALPQVAGEAACDLLPGNGTGFGYALRYAGIVPGSESVSVDGRTLKRGTDYTLDYPSGTLTFYSAVKQHQSVQITYRHSDKLVGEAKALNLNLMSLSFGQAGGMKGVFSLQPAERGTDGSIVQRMSYGLATNFKLATGTGLSGYFFVSNQRSMQAFADPASPERKQTRKQADVLDHLLVQDLTVKEGGFRAGFSYQDVGSKFNGFQALREEGIAAEQVNAWQKERGIKRFGYTLGFGQEGGDLDTDFSSISDGKGTIERRSVTLKLGEGSLYWNSRSIGSAFTRFKDLAEKDAEQWAKERGITRENFGGALGFAGGGLKFDKSEITDAGGSIDRLTLGFESEKVKLSHYEQNVDAGFSRFNDLAEGERGQWAKERGWGRSGFSVSVADFAGRKDVWNTYRQDTVDTPTGDLHRQALDLSGQGWQAKWTSTETDADFTGLASLRPDEQQQMIREARQGYVPGDDKIAEKDPQFLLRQGGLSRDYKSFSLDRPFGKFSFDTLHLDDRSGGIDRVRLGFSSGSMTFSYLDQRIDRGFRRMGDLFEMEQALYGGEVGMHRTQWALGFGLPRGGKLSFQSLNIAGELGGLERQSLYLKSGLYEVTANLRQVDDAFLGAGAVADPERKLFEELRGFSQYDLSAKVDLVRGLRLELFQFNADNPTAQIHKGQTKSFLTWKPDKRTDLSHFNDRVRADSPIASLNDYLHEKTTYARDFGSLGKFSGFTEREVRGGSLAAPVEKQVDHWRYEGSPYRGFALLAEDLRTSDTAGNTEHVSVRSISGALTPRAKFGVTEKTIERDEQRADEVHRTYSLQYDFGKGSQVTWAYTRALNSKGNGKAVQNLSLTKTLLWNLEFQGGYVEDRLDLTSTKAQGTFGLKNVTPFSFGPLSNINFSFGYQNLAEATVLKMENKAGTITADWGKNKLGWTYSGIMTPTGIRAVDRTFQFATDPEPKLPFHLNLSYKIRTLPGGTQQIIRNYHLDYKIADRLTLVHDLKANPEREHKDVPFGTIINPTGTADWRLDYKMSDCYDLAGSYLTTYDATKGQIARKGGLTLTRKTRGGLPLWNVGYGVEASTLNGRSTIGHTFTLGYSHTLNPLNALSFSVSHTQYEHDIPNGRGRNYLVGKVDYTLRF